MLGGLCKYGRDPQYVGRMIMPRGPTRSHIDKLERALLLVIREVDLSREAARAGTGDQLGFNPRSGYVEKEDTYHVFPLAGTHAYGEWLKWWCRWCRTASSRVRVE